MKAVVVHRGGRDGYQVARALSDAGLLEGLVTDLYWRAEAPWARSAEDAMPSALRTLVRKRWAGGPIEGPVRQCWFSGAATLGIGKSKAVPFEWQARSTRWADTCLGRAAGDLANRRKSALLSYSYYAHSAFSKFTGDGPRILFQVHPHPAVVRQILLEERHLHPECAASLDKEWELALPEDDFCRLVEESKMADHWIAASSFTRDSLVCSGIPEDKIHVVPYGADLERFHPLAAPQSRAANAPLRLLFTGTVNQRKGILYLLQALDLVKVPVELTIVGRIVDDLSLMRNRANVRVRSWVSDAELVEAYQMADLFVFPSLAEGFGHVLLEALACGLPIVSTTRTAAADIIQHGVHGYLIQPGEPAQIADAITQFAAQPERHAEMKRAARACAEQFTWQRFRTRVADVVGSIVNAKTEVAAV